MKLFAVFGLLFVAQSIFAEQIDVDVCNAAVTNEYVAKIDLAIDPNPIEIKAGKTISLHFGVDVLKEIAVGASISLNLKKGLLPIPCLDVRLIKSSIANEALFIVIDSHSYSISPFSCRLVFLFPLDLANMMYNNF